MVDKVGAGDVLGLVVALSPLLLAPGRAGGGTDQRRLFYGTRLRLEAEHDHDLGYELMRRVAAVAIQRLQAARKISQATIFSRNMTKPNTSNPAVIRWVEDMAALCQPDNVFWCDGSERKRTPA